jgi:hypothetical protein
MLGRAAITLQQLTAERGSATHLDGVEHARLGATQPVRGAKRRTVPSQDMRELELAACRIRLVRMRSHRSLEARGIGPLQQIER